jgi:hypothetical protein
MSNCGGKFAGFIFHSFYPYQTGSQQAIEMNVFSPS